MSLAMYCSILGRKLFITAACCSALASRTKGGGKFCGCCHVSLGKLYKNTVVPKQVLLSGKVWLVHCPHSVCLLPYTLFRYWRYNEDLRTMDPGYPKPISVWKGIPESPQGAFVDKANGRTMIMFSQSRLVYITNTTTEDFQYIK